jgi:hypothetical protein
MQNTLEKIVAKFGLSPLKRGHTEIPNYGRDKFGELFRELGFKVGAEIGTERGVYAEILCKSYPEMTLYCVDPWLAHDEYKEPLFNPVMDRNYEITKERLAPYNCKILRMMSDEALAQFPDESLDFVYLDGNHAFESVVFDVHNWSKKVRPGGIVAGHDYMRPKSRDGEKNISHHVVEAINAYTDAYRIRPWFVVGRDAKIPGELRDNSRSWMFVKQ